VVADITKSKILEQEAKELSKRLINLQEEERQRIAQELHDSTAQHIVAANLNLMSLRPLVGLTSEASKRWDETEACLQEAIKEIRSYSYLMHPPALEADGLTLTIRVYVDGYRDRTGLDVGLRLDPKLDRLPLEMQRTLLRIVQEALANVYRHATASRVRIDGRLAFGRVHLIIGDDGSGFADQENVRSGRGVPGMRARVQQWGGELRIRADSKGTRVHAMVPTRH
jgi:signal transduction histidine kinase